MKAFLQDLRLSSRLIRRAPVWTTSIALTLALAVGLTGAVYSVFHVVLLRSLPYERAGDLYMLHDQYLSQGYTKLGMSEPELYDFRTHSRHFETLAPYRTGEVRLDVGDEVRPVDVAMVTNELFEILGKPAIGRTFSEDELAPGGNAAVAILSHAFFTQHFGGEAAKIGDATVVLEDETHLVIGVMPEGFLLPADLADGEPTPVHVPLVLNPGQPGYRTNPNLNVVARLRAESSIEAAEREKEEILSMMLREHDEYPEDAGFNIIILPVLDVAVGDVRQALMFVLLAVGLVFLVAMSNVVSLVLARLDKRRSEIGTRLALGAAGRQLFRQMCAESLVLALLGGIPGLIIGHLAFNRFASNQLRVMPRLEESGLNASLFAIWLMLIGVSVVIVACVAALRVLRAKNLQQTLREESSGTTMPASRSWMRSLLVVAQVGLSLVLTTSAGLLVQSYQNIGRAELGFDTEELVVTPVILPASAYGRGSGAATFYESLLREVTALPGIERAAVVGWVPLDARGEVWPVEVEGLEHESPPTPEAQVVSSGYFATLGIEILAGEDFPSTYDAQSNRIVLVNQAMVDEYLPEGEAIGRRLQPQLIPDGPWVTIAGVVGNVKSGGFDDDPQPKVYYHHAQIPDLVHGVAFRRAKLVAKSSAPIEAMRGPIEQKIFSLDPTVPLQPMTTMQAVADRITAPLRFTLGLLTTFSFLALVLTLVGIYGLISEFAGRRRREMAIRQVLGADRQNILKRILTEAIRLIVAGIVVGIAASTVFSDLVAHMLYGVDGHRWQALLATSAAIVVFGTLACLIPAWRTATVSLAAETRHS